MNIKKILALTAILSGLIMPPTGHAGMLAIDNLSIATSRPSINNEPSINKVELTQPLSETALSLNAVNQKTGAIVFSKLIASSDTSPNNDTTVSWLLDKGLFSGEPDIAINFIVLASHNNPTKLEFLFNNKSLANLSITGDTKNVPVSFALTPSQLLEMNNGGNLALRIGATPNLDFAFDTSPAAPDNHPNNVPEPALVGLIGLGLTCLGFLRKKGQN
jgi:hypothetical protein